MTNEERSIPELIKALLSRKHRKAGISYALEVGHFRFFGCVWLENIIGGM